LFDAFFTTKENGMGIGLSVSRAIVENHHGRIWAKPNDGYGASVSFSIPLRPENKDDQGRCINWKPAEREHAVRGS
jgi:signal transduction histidine kinase